MTESLSIYDEIPYVDDPIRASHPAHLATIGTFFGMSPASPEKCRVLELGCAHGGNIIPLAYLYPESEFVGCDLSRNQIENGEKFIRQLGLKNIALYHKSLSDIDSSLGLFDFIIVHGVLSWVPKEVGADIFGVFAGNLSEQGIAYISYNTLPGWHARLTLREMMMFESLNGNDPASQVKEARKVLEIISGSLASINGHFASAVKEELPAIMGMPDWYFNHDFIAETNIPYYFREVAALGEKHNLQYVGDSEISWVTMQNLPAQARDYLRRFSADIVRLEHYLDLAQNRMFRRSLFCRKEIKLIRRISHEKLHECYIASPLTPKRGEKSDKIEKFEHPNGGAVQTDDAVLQDVISKLGSTWPESMTFRDLLIASKVEINSAEVVKKVSDYLIRGHLANLIELSLYPNRFVAKVSAKPRASGLARIQSATGSRVTNLKHEVVEFDMVEKLIISLLDGTRTEEEIFSEVTSKLSPIVNASTLETIDQMREYLEKFAKRALLEG